MAINTAFSFNPDPVAQFTGTGAAVVNNSPTYAATQAIAPQIVAGARCILINGVNSVSAATTITNTATLPFGAQVQVVVKATGGTVTATFSTGFKVSATAAATIGTQMTVDFTSDGTNLVESGRSLAIAF